MRHFFSTAPNVGEHAKARGKAHALTLPVRGGILTLSRALRDGPVLASPLTFSYRCR
jgi:hypothetical protein